MSNTSTAPASTSTTPAGGSPNCTVPSPPSSSVPASSTKRMRIECTPISVRRPRTRSTRWVRGQTDGKLVSHTCWNMPSTLSLPCWSISALSATIAKSRCRSRHPDRGDDVVLLDVVDDVHPLTDLPEHRVNPIEMRLRRVADEELAAAGVFARVGYGQGAGHVLVGVEVRLALDLVARPAGADPGIVGV